MTGLFDDDDSGTPTPAPQSPAPPAKVHYHGPIPGVEAIAGITMEAVIGGARQSIAFTAGTNPYEAVHILRRLDPHVQVHKDLPKAGWGGKGGKRDTKAATVCQVSITARDSYLGMEMTAQTAEGEAVIVKVGKNKIEEMPQALADVGTLNPLNLEKLQAAITDKVSAVVLIMPPETFAVHYWTSDKGDHFCDHLAKPAEGGAHAEG